MSRLSKDQDTLDNEVAVIAFQVGNPWNILVVSSPNLIDSF